MADVLFVLCCLANQMNIDLEDAMKENMQKKPNETNYAILQMKN